MHPGYGLPIGRWSRNKAGFNVAGPLSGCELGQVVKFSLPQIFTCRARKLNCQSLVPLENLGARGSPLVKQCLSLNFFSFAIKEKRERAFHGCETKTKGSGSFCFLLMHTLHSTHYNVHVFVYNVFQKPS